MSRQPKTAQPKVKHKGIVCFYHDGRVESAELIRDKQGQRHMACVTCAARHRATPTV